MLSDYRRLTNLRIGESIKMGNVFRREESYGSCGPIFVGLFELALGLVCIIVCGTTMTVAEILGFQGVWIGVFVSSNYSYIIHTLHNPYRSVVVYQSSPAETGRFQLGMHTIDGCSFKLCLVILSVQRWHRTDAT